MSRRAAHADGAAPGSQGRPPALLGGWTLGFSRLRLLAAVSALSTGLVIWAGLQHPGSSGLARALAQRQRLLARSASAPAATAPASSAGQAPEAGQAGEAQQGAAQGEAQSEAGAQSTAGAAGSQGGSQSAPSGAGESQPGASSPAQSPATTPAAGSPRAPAKAQQAKIKHVFVIVLSSPGYEQTWGPSSQARYLTTRLRPQGTLLSDYYAVAHLDLPNYIAMISGQPPNALTEADCSTFAQFPTGATPAADGAIEAPGCVYPINTLTLGDQLTSSHLQWRAYVEDLANGPKPVQSCRHPAIGAIDETQHARPGDGYAARHNPFVYFHSLLDLGDCASNDLPITQLPSDLASQASTPNYAFIVPNLCNDGSESPCANGTPGGLQAADAFLEEWVPRIIASPAYRRSGLLVITFDDAPASDDSGCCGAPSASAPASQGGGRVGALLLSPFAKPGGESTTPYNHYSLLRSVEDIFGLSHLADAGQPGVSSLLDSALTGALPASASRGARR